MHVLHPFSRFRSLIIPLKRTEVVVGVVSEVGEGVDEVRAQGRVDVFWDKPRHTLAVLGPVGVIAHSSLAAWGTS